MRTKEQRVYLVVRTDDEGGSGVVRAFGARRDARAYAARCQEYIDNAPPPMRTADIRWMDSAARQEWNDAYGKRCAERAAYFAANAYDPDMPSTDMGLVITYVVRPVPFGPPRGRR